MRHSLHSRIFVRRHLLTPNFTKDGEVEPFDWCCEGRGGLDSWKALGYIPVQDFDYKGFGTMTRSLSRTLEYSYNDFSISQIGFKLGGKEDDVEKYTSRSQN